MSEKDDSSSYDMIFYSDLKKYLSDELSLGEKSRFEALLEKSENKKRIEIFEERRSSLISSAFNLRLTESELNATHEKVEDIAASTQDEEGRVVKLIEDEETWGSRLGGALFGVCVIFLFAYLTPSWNTSFAYSLLIR